MNRQRLFFFLGILYLIQFFVYPIIFHWNDGGEHDWNGFEAFSAIARYFYLKFHTLPLWDSYRLGGYPYLANPEQHAFSPFIILELLFGVGGGLKITIFLHALIGYLGVWFWLKKSNPFFHPMILSVSAFTYITSGYFIAHLSVGHFGWLAYSYWPWIILSLNQLKRVGDRYWFLLLITYTLLFTLGSPNFIIYTFLLSVILIATKLLSYPHLKSLVVPFSAAFLAMLIALPSLITSISWVGGEFPRTLVENESLSLINIINSFFIPLFKGKKLLFSEQKYFNHEYFNYINLMTIFLFLFSVIPILRSKLREEHLRLLLLGGVGLLLSFGDFGAYSPYALLHKLPFFSSMRVPFRYLLFLIPMIIYFSAIGGQSLLDRIKELPQKKEKLFFSLFATVMLVVPMLLNIPTQNYFYKSWSTGKDISFFNNYKEDPIPKEFEQKLNPHYFLRERTLTPYRGILNCVYSFPIPIGRLSEGRLLESSRGEILHWKPNSFQIKMKDLQATSPIILNMNYNRNWKCNNGEVTLSRGLLAVVNYNPKELIFLEYQDHRIFLAFFISLLSILLVIGMAFFYKFRANSSKASRRYFKFLSGLSGPKKMTFLGTI